MKPLVVDLYCGLGGWAEGFLAEGWDVIGFDIERHCYGNQKYPAQLVLADVLGLWGSQFRHVDAIVASPPCQKYSYMAMPWSRAKALAAWYREIELRQIALNALFSACFRIQREASEAARRHIPMVVENVKGAQPWVGPAQAHFGSFYLWGDVRQVGGRIVSRVPKFGEGFRAAKRRKVNSKYKGSGFWQTEDGRDWRDITNTVEGCKNGGGGSWFPISRGVDNGAMYGTNPARGESVGEGIKQDVENGGNWFGPGENMSLQRRANSHSKARKAASAMIAKIPFHLARHIARGFQISEHPWGRNVNREVENEPSDLSILRS